MSPEIVRWIKVVVMRTLKEKNLTRLDVSTLISAGNLGYVQALSRFDPGRQLKFKTFAEYRIKGAVLDEVRKMIGDERCKNKRPRKVDDFDYTTISDMGVAQSETESNMDIRNFLDNVPLTLREVQILRCRMYGMNLKEIARKFKFSESRASQLLASIKKEVYTYYREEGGINFKLTTTVCPACQHENIISDRVNVFSCDSCDVTYKLNNGSPIVVSEEQSVAQSEEEGDEDFFEDKIHAMGH
jgi:RNA polymerase sigma factor (sigma-70 family)